LVVCVGLCHSDRLLLLQVDCKGATKRYKLATKRESYKIL
jgi:hypothetical protein